MTNGSDALQNTIGRDTQLSDSALMAASRPQHSAFGDSRPVIRFPGGNNRPAARAPAASPLGGSPLQVRREPFSKPLMFMLLTQLFSIGGLPLVVCQEVAHALP